MVEALARSKEARGGGNAKAAKELRLGHGGRSRERRCSEGEGRGSEWRRVRALGITSSGSVRAGACGTKKDMRLPAWSPRRHSIEHVASNSVAIVGCIFGPVMGRFRP
jgi:hypothetical protein